jgi:hypothetical protein
MKYFTSPITTNYSIRGIVTSKRVDSEVADIPILANNCVIVFSIINARENFVFKEVDEAFDIESYLEKLSNGLQYASVVDDRESSCNTYVCPDNFSYNETVLKWVTTWVMKCVHEEVMNIDENVREGTLFIEAQSEFSEAMDDLESSIILALQGISLEAQKQMGNIDN